MARPLPAAGHGGRDGSLMARRAPTSFSVAVLLAMLLAFPALAADVEVTGTDGAPGEAGLTAAPPTDGGDGADGESVSAVNDDGTIDL
ncbi:MAG: hypothetical protein OEW88_03385, partial [Gammaproteobacteria bacterium]|nr:hypothetical protein [Gammaproteobacteria bacterium]